MIEKHKFGKLPDGGEASVFRLRNKRGTIVTLTDFGATVVSLTVPDRNGKFEDVAAAEIPTVINLTNHTYFDIRGDPNATILDEELCINAEEFTPVDRSPIPTGDTVPVAGTPMDFLKPPTLARA